MDYRDRLYEVFEGKGPKNLRAIFDCESNEWQDTTMEKKVFYLNKMLDSGYPIEMWIEDYKVEYAYTHPHILKCIDNSIEIIKEKMEDSLITRLLDSYLKQAPKRKISEFSKKFLFNAYFNLKEGVEIACIKRAYRDMNRTLSNFQVVLEPDGKKNIPQSENKRKIVRECWQQFLLKKISELKVKIFDNNTEYDLWHRDVCIGLSKTSSHELTLGQAQKWVNMTIKYLVVFGDSNILRNIKYFHIPIDSLIMEELNSKIFNIAKLETPWSKINDWDKYFDYQMQFRETIIPKIPLEMEFEIFNKILARTVKKA